MEESAVAHAYQAYGAAVYARCRRILRDGDGARDVTQEVFLRCFNHRATLRPGRELLAWLYRVATNLCLNALRDSDRRRRADLLDALVEAVSPEGPARRLLRDLFADLDPRTQAIVVYVYLDGMTQDEAAEVAQVSDRTVRNCLARFNEEGRRRMGDDPEPFLRGEFG